MKLISSIMDHVNLVKGKVNFIYVSDVAKEFILREEISNWCNGKKDVNDLFFLLDDNKELTAKNCNSIELYGGNTNGLSDKHYIQWVKYQILNTPEYYMRLQEVQKHLELFLFGIQLNLNGLHVDLYLEEFPIEQLLKNVTFEIELTGKYSKGYLFNRSKIISLWDQMIFNENPKIVFYYFPESDGVNTESIKFLKYLENQNYTVIALTRSLELMRNFELNQVHLVKRNGTFYPINELYLHLVAFNLYVDDSTTIELAFKDFHEDYTLLNDQYREFLLSGKFFL